MNWYYDLGGQRQGPVPEAEIDRLLAAGTITTNTLVWCEGMENWTPLKDARPGVGAAPAAGADVPDGWIRCAATGRYFPPSQIVWLDGKAYSAEAKAGIVQGVMQGGELPSGDEALRTGPAWEQRAQLGLFKAIWETVKAVLLDPNQAFATMKRDGGFGAPLGFYMLVATAGVIISLVFNLAFQESMLSFLPKEAQQQAFPSLAAGAGSGAIFIVGITVVAVLAMLVGTFVSAGILHLSLMICSGAKQPFETTFRTGCYAIGAGSALALIPLCGSSIGFLWGVVCLCMGLAKTHEINTGRAVCAVLLPLVTCCGLYILLIVVAIAIPAAAAGMKQ